MKINDDIYLERCRTQSFKKVVSVDENKCETTCSNTLMSMCVMCKSLSPKNGVQFIFLDWMVMLTRFESENIISPKLNDHTYMQEFRSKQI